MERRNATVENERMADVRGREMTRNQNSEPREKERRKSRNQEIKKSRKRREKLINRKENNNNKITKRNGRKGGGGRGAMYRDAALPSMWQRCLAG